MIEINKLEAEKKDKLVNSYICTLPTPIDSYHEGVTIKNSACYEIVYSKKKVGHICVDDHKTLVQFHVEKEYFIKAPEIFQFVIENNIIKKAVVSTKEQEYLSLCLDYQKSAAVDVYLFSDGDKRNYELDGFNSLSFRLGENNDIDTIKNTCDPAFDGYYENLIENNQLFVLYDGAMLLGIGEFRISSTHPGFGDIGMSVVEEFRRKGVGTYIITKLKEECYKNKLIPMAGCNVKNIASKRTLEKCGFIGNHRIIIANFSD